MIRDKNIYKYILFILIAMTLVSCNHDINNSNTNNTIEENETSRIEEAYSYNDSFSENTLAANSLSYLGAFLLPNDGMSEQEMFSYGGEAICYNANNNSLFITGHNWYANVAEITIPEAIVSKDKSDLNKAQIINDFKNIKGNLFNKWTMEIPRVGLEVVDDSLFFCFGQHYEEDTKLGTHGYTELNLSKADKVCATGDYLYSTNDYMFSIPKGYVDSFGGNDLLTGRFRDGGWSGMGPSLFAVSSQDIINAKSNQSIQAIPIIKYQDSYNGDDGSKMSDYAHADSWTGGAFVSCDTGDSIIFAGTHSYGYTWYGFSNGVVYPTDGDENTVYPDVPEYPYDERGWWSNDFRACIALYHTRDAIKVYNGEINPFEIQPYEFIDISEYMNAERDETDMQYLGGVAYDNINNRLYILELFADEDRPIVHVFTFE